MNYFKIEKLVGVEIRFQTFIISEACQQQMEDCDADHQLSVEEGEDSKVETFGRSDMEKNGGSEKKEEKEEVEAKNDEDDRPADEGDKMSTSSIACLSNVGIEKIPSMEVVDDLVQMENSEDEQRSVGREEEEEGGGQNEQESQEERTQIDDNEMHEKEKEIGNEKVKGEEGESYEHELNEMEEKDNEKQGMEDVKDKKEEEEQSDGKEENAEEGRRLIIMLGETDFTSFTSCSLASSGTLINVSTAQQGEGGDGDEEQRGADKADADVRGGVSKGLEDMHPAGDALKCTLHFSKNRKFQTRILQQRR